MIYPFDEPVPPQIAIVRVNERMIQKISRLPASVCRPGKTRGFLEYAQRQTTIMERIGAEIH